MLEIPRLVLLLKVPGFFFWGDLFPGNVDMVQCHLIGYCIFYMLITVVTLQSMFKVEAAPHADDKPRAAFPKHGPLSQEYASLPFAQEHIQIAPKPFRFIILPIAAQLAYFWYTFDLCLRCMSELGMLRLWKQGKCCRTTQACS